MKEHRWQRTATAHAGGVEHCADCGVWRADVPSLRPCPGPRRPSWRAVARALLEHWRPVLFRAQAGEVAPAAQWGLFWRSDAWLVG